MFLKCVFSNYLTSINLKVDFRDFRQHFSVQWYGLICVSSKLHVEFSNPRNDCLCKQLEEIIVVINDVIMVGRNLSTHTGHHWKRKLQRCLKSPDSLLSLPSLSFNLSLPLLSPLTLFLFPFTLSFLRLLSHPYMSEYEKKK